MKTIEPEKLWYYYDGHGIKTFVSPIGKLQNGFYLMLVTSGESKGQQINLHVDSIKYEVPKTVEIGGS